MSLKHILVATDFSESAAGALELALEISEKFNTALTLMHCWETPSYAYGGGLYVPVDAATPIEQAATRALQEALAQLQLRLPRATSALRSGPAWEQIIDAAKERGADLIALGTHGRRGLDHVLMGSVAERVVRMARMPVLTVHGAQNSK